MLDIFGREDREQWDETALSFEDCDVYYLSGYAEAFYINGDGVPYLLYYHDEHCRGINVVMLRDIAKDKHFTGKIPENTYFDIITPYGYGGWLIEGNCDNGALFDAYSAWCAEWNIISEFVRFSPVLGNESNVKDFYEVIRLGSTVMLDISSRDTVFANLTSKNRNMIRKAVKNGIKINRAKTPEIFAKFKQIYDETMDKDNAEDYYYFDNDFYLSICNDLQHNSEVFYAYNENDEIIAASIIIFSNGHLNYHLSGSKRQYQNLAPTNLLLYEAALWGCDNGMKTFHLGGGLGGKEDSLFSFKKSFNRNEPLSFYIGKKIFNQDIYDKLVRIRNEEINSSFFPLYRA